MFPSGARLNFGERSDHAGSVSTMPEVLNENKLSWQFHCGLSEGYNTEFREKGYFVYHI